MSTENVSLSIYLWFLWLTTELLLHISICFFSVNLPPETLNSVSLLVGSIKLQRLSLDECLRVSSLRVSYWVLATVNPLLNSIELLCAENN